MPLFSGVGGTACVSVYSLLIRQCKYVEKGGQHIPCGRHELTYHEWCCQLSSLAEICLNTTARSTHPHWICLAMQNRELLPLLCRWDVETELPGFVPLYFKLLYWVSGNVVVQGPLSVSGKRTAFSDAVQPTQDMIHHLQVPISSPCAQKVHESTRFNVKGLSFMPKALWDEPKSKWYS